jgi:RNA polymerase sigma-70 factor, ECF subfamily
LGGTKLLLARVGCLYSKKLTWRSINQERVRYRDCMDLETPVPAVMRLGERIHRHQAEVLAFLMRRAPQEAEELAQETWLRVHRANPICESEGAFRAYVFTVARRILIDHYRRRSSRVPLVPLEGGLEPSTQVSPHGSVVAAQTLQVVEGTLAEMRPEIAEVFRLRMTSRLSFKDIAARQGVPINTALGRMHRATKRLHNALCAAGLRT